MTLSKLIVPGLLLSSSLLAQKNGAQAEANSIAAQLSSLHQQRLSVEAQQQSLAKQGWSIHRMLKQTAFLEPLRAEAQYLDCDALAPAETEKLIASASRAQSVSPDLLRAVIRQESAFRPCAISEKGAQGLMQLMPATAAALNVSDPFDPQQNILGGAAYLRQLMQRYAGDASLALSAYNAGPQRVDHVEGIPDIPETRNYVTSIFRDLGWTLPQRPTVPLANGLEPIEADTNIRIDGVDQDVLQVELEPEEESSNPGKEKPSMPESHLP